MKLHNIAIAGLSALALGACSDYLDVDAPSKTQLPEAYGSANDVNTALNGVYAQLLSWETYGEKLLTIYTLNSDVDFAIDNGHYAKTNSYRRFECDPDASDIYKAWSQFYATIEAANIFVDQLENSELMNDIKEYKNFRQKLGEAKVIRAMNYHDLIWMFGDVPMSFAPSYKAESMIYPVTDRAEIIDKLIEDLREIAPDMTSGSDLDCDHICQEMAWAMIARLSLTAAGYTLRPDGSSYGKMEPMNPGKENHYYELCRDYCDSVISSGTYDLVKYKFHEVFVNECNGILSKGGDVIFEIPFGRESTGSIGYIHGPKLDADNGTTAHPYGAANSAAQLNAFYRFFFDEKDVRRDYINQMIYYPSTNKATYIYTNNKARTIYNGKWSKLWVTGGLGDRTTGSTGINYPYMRYTDVLLMFAEAVNECENGISGKHGQDAIEALQTVRQRAFLNNPELVGPFMTEATASPEAFRDAVLDERKFEFAGENMRWRDLIRHNRYAENTFWNFYRYFGMAQSVSGDNDNIMSVAKHDFDDDGYYDSDRFPFYVYYKEDQTRTDSKNFKGKSHMYTPEEYPNQDVKVVDIYGNSDYKYVNPTKGRDYQVSEALMFEWFDDNKGFPQDYFCYSLRGYIYCDYELTGRIMINNNGVYTSAPDPASILNDATSLPVVRYILPYPRNVVNRANGQYVNKYGY